MTKVKVIKKDVKHINLKVKPNGEVILTAPTDAMREISAHSQTGDRNGTHTRDENKMGELHSE